jgi:hypothetical protein
MLQRQTFLHKSNYQIQLRGNKFLAFLNYPPPKSLKVTIQELKQAYFLLVSLFQQYLNQAIDRTQVWGVTIQKIYFIKN